MIEPLKLRNFMSDASKALQDITNAFSSWRIFCLIGINDIRKRYARSRLGQFWLTLSLAVNIGSLGVVWAYLFKIPVNVYLPYIAFSIIFWSHISSCITDGTTVFINSGSYLKELSIAKTSYIYSLFVKNFIILAHNLAILIPIYLFCPFSVSPSKLLISLIGIILTTLFLFPVTIFLATLSLRFRDFPNIIASLMQIIFYITPVMWKSDLMPAAFRQYLIFNPAAVFLSLCRDSFFADIEPLYFLAAVVYIAIAWLIAFPLFSKFRARIIYWL
jgi:ABC-type polysaccharide/polyol phosphate export permease